MKIGKEILDEKMFSADKELLQSLVDMGYFGRKPTVQWRRKAMRTAITLLEVYGLKDMADLTNITPDGGQQSSERADWQPLSLQIPATLRPWKVIDSNVPQNLIWLYYWALITLRKRVAWICQWAIKHLPRECGGSLGSIALQREFEFDRALG